MSNQERKVSCEHCRNNPQATKPLIKMKKMRLTPLTVKLIPEAAKLLNCREECVTCKSLEIFFKQILCG